MNRRGFIGSLLGLTASYKFFAIKPETIIPPKEFCDKDLILEALKSPQQHYGLILHTDKEPIKGPNLYSIDSCGNAFDLNFDSVKMIEALTTYGCTILNSRGQPISTKLWSCGHICVVYGDQLNVTYRVSL